MARLDNAGLDSAGSERFRPILTGSTEVVPNSTEFGLHLAISTDADTRVWPTLVGFWPALANSAEFCRIWTKFGTASTKCGRLVPILAQSQTIAARLPPDVGDLGPSWTESGLDLEATLMSKRKALPVSGPIGSTQLAITPLQTGCSWDSFRRCSRAQCISRTNRGKTRLHGTCSRCSTFGVQGPTELVMLAKL